MWGFNKENMKLIKQKTEHSCGQACVAMIAGITLKKSIDIFGNDKRTTTKQLKQAFEQLGIKTGKRRERISKNRKLPNLCIVSIKWSDNGKRHWSVCENGKFYDPYFGHVKKYDNGKILSFLRIIYET